MSVLRFLSTLCLLIAVIALVSDLTPAITEAKGLSLSSIETQWKEVAPATFQSLEESVQGGRASWQWRFLIGPLLLVPTCLMFAGLSVLFGYLGRRRSRVKIYAN